METVDVLLGGVPQQSNEEIASAISHMTPAEVEVFWSKAGYWKRQKVGGWAGGHVGGWASGWWLCTVGAAPYHAITRRPP